jgi:predicted nuclease of predicted toxin-antitoxin system
MTIWIDAQLSPAIAAWITSHFPVQAIALCDLGLRDATDRQIFAAAQQMGAVVMTKDSDFVELVEHYGAPPQVLWLRCGNTSNARLKQILSATLSQALLLLEAGESLIEINAT